MGVYFKLQHIFTHKPVEKVFDIFVFPQGWEFAVVDESLDSIQQPVDGQRMHGIADAVVEVADAARHFRRRRRHLDDDDDDAAAAAVTAPAADVEKAAPRTNRARAPESADGASLLFFGRGL